MNRQKYLELLQDKLEIHVQMHGCSLFMHDVASLHKANKVQEYLKKFKVTTLKRSCNYSALNHLEHL